MRRGRFLGRVFFPPAAVDGRDTGLRFTDILFGFVIFQLFLRLQSWGALPGFVRWQLIVGTTLVLGSWIGFRRSLNRSDYQPKFFNLPFFRFVLDQVMVLLYFRIAVLYPNDENAILTPSSTIVDPSTLAHDTVFSLLLIFALYVAWDLLGIRMAYVREGDKPKYPEITDDGKAKTEIPQTPNWPGWTITFCGLVAFALLYWWVQSQTLDVRNAKIAFAIATILLLGYRMAKEIRTSLKTGAAADTHSDATPDQAAAWAAEAATAAATAATKATKAAEAATAAKTATAAAAEAAAAVAAAAAKT